MGSREILHDPSFFTTMETQGFAECRVTMRVVTRSRECWMSLKMKAF